MPCPRPIFLSLIGINVRIPRLTIDAHDFNTLTAVGFVIKEIQESKPTLEAMEHDKEMKDEMRRPMFLLIKAIK